MNKKKLLNSSSSYQKKDIKDYKALRSFIKIHKSFPTKIMNNVHYGRSPDSRAFFNPPSHPVFPGQWRSGIIFSITVAWTVAEFHRIPY